MTGFCSSFLGPRPGSGGGLPGSRGEGGLPRLPLRRPSLSWLSPDSRRRAVFIHPLCVRNGQRGPELCPNQLPARFAPGSCSDRGVSSPGSLTYRPAQRMLPLQPEANSHPEQPQPVRSPRIPARWLPLATLTNWSISESRRCPISRITRLSCTRVVSWGLPTLRCWGCHHACALVPRRRRFLLPCPDVPVDLHSSARRQSRRPSATPAHDVRIGPSLSSTGHTPAPYR